MERINEMKMVHGAFHANLTGCGCCQPGEGSWSPPLPADPSLDFHRYGVVWSPPAPAGNDSLTFYYDDLYYFSALNVSAQLPAGDTLGFHVILNTAVGGSWPGAPNASTIFPQHHLIDYVRYAVYD